MIVAAKQPYNDTIQKIQEKLFFKNEGGYPFGKMFKYRHEVNYCQEGIMKLQQNMPYLSIGDMPMTGNFCDFNIGSSIGEFKFSTEPIIILICLFIF